jgi:uncharacterized protein YggE
VKIVVAVVSVVAVALIAASLLGVAGAETTTTATPIPSAPTRTVSVQGVGSVSLEPTASAAAATTAYRSAMAAAIGDGQSKAQFLAEKAGASLGQVQSIGEGSGSIQCPGEEEYAGGQPDFGSGAPVAVAPFAASVKNRATVRRAPAVKPHKGRRRSAHKSAVEPCALSTQVALVYQLN